MIRTNTTFTLLQAITAVVTLAIILWFIGVPSFRTAEAANVISFSNTLSDSEPGMVSNHTLSFVLPTGLPAASTISINFATTGFSGIDDLVAQDVDLDVDGVEQDLIDGAANGTDWNVNAAGTVVDITSDTSTIGSNATVTIEIGTNASNGGAGTNQISNPTVGSYEITLTAGTSTGATRVAIVNVVTVTAAVETVFNFTVLGVDAGIGINEDTTTSTTTPTEIPFGVLVADTPKVAAQDLQVETNAANGFVVTVQTDQQLTSATGADIDGFRNGTFDSTPEVWEAPTVVLGSENTYGHWGITTDDETLTAIPTDLFFVGTVEANSRYASASSTPVEIFRNDGPTNETGQGVGTTRVGYAVEITGLQEAGDDYTATLTYVATPVF